MTLQAIFDDSGGKGTGRFMAMSGLLGSAELIAAVADNWDKHLLAKHPGSIRYSKMDEAVTLDGEFRHWYEDNRDAKVLQMANVINRHDLFAISATLDLKAFETVFADWIIEKSRPHAFTEPYLLLSQYVLAAAVTESLNRSSTKPLEIIYDQHDKFKPIITNHYEMLRYVVGAKNPARLAVMPIQPWFRDDKEFVMIQAADLLAGEARLVAEQSTVMPQLGKFCPQLKKAGDIVLLDEAWMRSIKGDATPFRWDGD